ncbi:hypothetical protein M378DRAFT_299713 [Amanita muscaria Koide BX008]|uniref:Secreted protein n=1 Tax=Amanita muscaria (strain Koide BX008) TaxID=946122 RepID=A0A0C2WZL9_AMAMK|nr:hypothetical protein M378DRAFT_299713 [Amanita muscaria Koide BX008]
MIGVCLVRIIMPLLAAYPLAHCGYPHQNIHLLVPNLVARLVRYYDTIWQPYSVQRLGNQSNSRHDSRLLLFLSRLLSFHGVHSYPSDLNVAQRLEPVDPRGRGGGSYSS